MTEELNRAEIEAEAKELLESGVEFKLDDNIETEYLLSRIEVLKYALSVKDEEFTLAWDSREISFQKKLDAGLHEHQTIVAAVDELRILADENKKLKEAIGKLNGLFAEADFEIQKRDLILEDLEYDMSKLDVKLDVT